MVTMCTSPNWPLPSLIVNRTLRSPSRFDAQADAVNLIFSAKTQANPESSVGLMSMGGKGPEVLVTLSTDFGKILDGLHRTKIRGGTHLATGIQVAGVRRPFHFTCH
jgi:26S proteasome regulatory subunit N10